MLSEDLLKKVKRIEINTRRIIDDAMAGRYRSHFKGHGVQFSEHRLYLPGDDVRHIDWKVSARSKEPMIKKYEEERELSVLLLVDVSGSEGFGSGKKLKSEVIAEVGAMLSFSAEQTGDKVGAILFSDQIEKILPPKRGKQHVLRMIRDLLHFEPKSRGTDVAVALRAASRVLKHSGIVFVLSDFLSESFDLELKRLSRRHDVVAVWIEDNRETEIPKMGLGRFIDPETGEEQWVDLSSYRFQNWFKDFKSKRESDVSAAFKGCRADVLRVSTKEDYGEAVVRFFRTRNRKFRS